jgi:ribosome-binding factor A
VLASFEAMAHRRSAKRSGSTQRQLRVGEMIRHAVAQLLTRGTIRDEVLLKRVVTVPEVRLTPDLRLASVYVLPLGGEGIQDVLAALNRNKRYIRGEVARAVNLKFAPEIRFMADETFDEARRIDELLRSPKVAADLKKSQSEC